MYEFSKKEIRKKFKETKLGKKLNSQLYISILVFFVVMLIIFVINYLIGTESQNIKEDTVISIMTTFNILTLFAVSAVAYFDGKRDGATEQFKTTLKKD